MSLFHVETDNFVFRGWRNNTLVGYPPGFYLMRKLDTDPRGSGPSKFQKAYGWIFDVWFDRPFPWVHCRLTRNEETLPGILA